MSSNLNTNRWLCITLLTIAGGALTLTGCGGKTTETRITDTRYVGVPVQTAPPPAREEVIGTPPTTGDIWIGGHWEWNGQEYVWTPGHWEPARPESRWVPDRWVQDGSSWRYYPGYWEAVR